MTGLKYLNGFSFFYRFTQNLKIFFNEPIMIFGADVTHPTPGESQSESIAAITASLDVDCTYYGSIFHNLFTAINRNMLNFLTMVFSLND